MFIAVRRTCIPSPCLDASNHGSLLVERTASMGFSTGDVCKSKKTLYMREMCLFGVFPQFFLEDLGHKCLMLSIGKLAMFDENDYKTGKKPTRTNRTNFTGHKKPPQNLAQSLGPDATHKQETQKQLFHRIVPRLSEDSRPFLEILRKFRLCVSKQHSKKRLPPFPATILKRR